MLRKKLFYQPILTKVRYISQRGRFLITLTRWGRYFKWYWKCQRYEDFHLQQYRNSLTNVNSGQNLVNVVKEWKWNNAHTIMPWLKILLKIFAHERDAWKRISSTFSCEWMFHCLVKFIYSEKTTNFCKISTLDLSYVVTLKSTVHTTVFETKMCQRQNFIR